MQLIDLSENRYTSAGIVAFGFFDCIHLGHQAVIGRAIALAREEGIPASVFLFRNNIYELIGIKKEPIFTFDERISQIDSLGADQVLFIDADRSFLSLSPQAYVDFLKRKVSIVGFTCGKDFTFGKDGAGNSALLQSLIGGRSEILDIFNQGGEKVSSDAVKRALLQGDVQRAAQLLGRPFSVRRVVLPGRHDGERIGFPTLNTDPFGVKMKKGVYFTTTVIDGQSYLSVTNVGDHPTFGDRKENIETYVLDYNGDLYGRSVEIVFHRYTREIVRFDSIERLTERIAADVSARRSYD